ncbi:barstar family protein [Mycolicibacterium sp. 050158]|uniref:barstar family protein n=1 Tax=Mycolicibacterium sp. 050158 TaxID=3090602 RepID=UPI00299D8A70|nr:barstar family protein [Mycolicibacterium sp. 050158]MDX1891460.1 barstar family protein [Mycolicibacterium sp. 050158]
MTEPLVFHLDGRRIRTTKDFYREIGRAVNGAGGYFGRNLDALTDCLRGGFGTPDDRPFEFEWQHSDRSRRHLESGFVDAVRAVFHDAGVTLSLR